MNTVKKIWRKTKKIVTPTRAIVLVIILVVVLWQVFKKEVPPPSYTIDKGVVERVVIASGKVEVSDQAMIGFQQSGTVSKVLVKSGQKVKAGQMIAQLDLGTLSADLRDAKASLREAKYKKQKSLFDASLKEGVLTTDTTNSSANLDTLRSKLLSSDLELYPVSSSAGSVRAPIISGTYNLKKDKASYKVSFYASSGDSGVSAKFVGEGLNQTVSLSSYFPAQIGTTGLYIQLPTDTTGLANTDWTLDLPNPRSSQYASNLYQYLDAKKNYENNLNNQANEISLITRGYNGYTEYDIAIERAQASIERAQQSIRLRGLYAPVSGIVGRIDLKLGQSVTQGADVATILGDGQLQTKLKVPESSVGGIHLDDPVVVSADIDPDTIFKGKIATIDQAETYLEGTPVYETTVVIDNPEALKTGMTVRGKITTDKRADVIRIPELALFDGTKGGYIVKKIIKVDESDTVDVPVKVLLRGTDGLIAIDGPLVIGDKVQLREEIKK